jgi:hypothetical protein
MKIETSSPAPSPNFQLLVLTDDQKIHSRIAHLLWILQSEEAILGFDCQSEGPGDIPEDSALWEQTKHMLYGKKFPIWPADETTNFVTDFYNQLVVEFSNRLTVLAPYTLQNKTLCIRIA